VLLSVIFCNLIFLFAGCARSPGVFQALPDFSLMAVTVDGTSPFDRRAMLGRVWIADFVYTRCAGPCPLLTANMSGLQKRLPKAIGLLSFTVDPDHDAPEVLNLYARKFAADPQRWFFVCGEKSELSRIFREGFKIAVAENQDAPTGQNIAHTTKFILIDASGRVRGYYDGDESASLKRLEIDARRLL
jgi:protein SCO1/2